MTDKKLHRLVLAALFTALTTVMTMVIQVPSPMQGYVNLGDCGVLLSAWVLGAGALVIRPLSRRYADWPSTLTGLMRRSVPLTSLHRHLPTT